MDAEYEIRYHRLEEKNWWFVARRQMILQLVKRGGFKKDIKILEIGCSGGSLIKFLIQNKFSNITGIDLSDRAIEWCKKRGVENVRVMDGMKTLFKDNEFDLVIVSDVLEHMKEDSMALAEWWRILKPGGTLVVFVPAFDFLWSSHDEINHHYRRYSKSDLEKKLKKANFGILYGSYWNFCLFFPVSLSRLWQRTRNRAGKSKDQLHFLNPLVNQILATVLQFENQLLRFLRFPFGVSVYAVCRK